MSSQDNAGIPLIHAPTGVGYKLLELPPELATLLESSNAPTLTLHASQTSALLRGNGKTYAVRQKNTSNALLLLAPSSSSSATPTPGSAEHVRDDQQDDQDAMARAVTGVNIVATMHETLELEEVQEQPATASTAASAPAPVPAARGKWHERFGRTR